MFDKTMHENRWKGKPYNHPVGTMFCPQGDIFVYAWKKPYGSWNDPDAEMIWELVIRTNKPRVADRVEQVYKDNGYKTRRDDG